MSLNSSEGALDVLNYCYEVSCHGYWAQFWSPQVDQTIPTHTGVRRTEKRVIKKMDAFLHFFITSLELLNLQRKREGNALRVSSITKAVDKVKAELSRNPAMPQLNLEKDWLKTDEKMFSAK